MSKVWLITGTSKGFGRIWARAALERGDKVAGTARDLATLDELVAEHGDAFLPLELDVNDSAADAAAVQRAAEHFGRLDVVVNNAGYGHFGAVEELTEAELRAQMETNFFGAVWVTKAALPIMREQGSGHLLQISSNSGLQAAPTLSAYCASKWALEGFSESLAGEVSQFGIRVTLIEPRGYETDWLTRSAVRSEKLHAYDPMREQRAALFKKSPLKRGDPQATPQALFAVVDSDDPPLRLFLGDGNLAAFKAEYARRIEIWEQWDDVAAAATARA